MQQNQTHQKEKLYGKMYSLVSSFTFCVILWNVACHLLCANGFEIICSHWKVPISLCSQDDNGLAPLGSSKSAAQWWPSRKVWFFWSIWYDFRYWIIFLTTVHSQPMALADWVKRSNSSCMVWLHVSAKSSVTSKCNVCTTQVDNWTSEWWPQDWFIEALDNTSWTKWTIFSVFTKNFPGH